MTDLRYYAAETRFRCFLFFLGLRSKGRGYKHSRTLLAKKSFPWSIFFALTSSNHFSGNAFCQDLEAVPFFRAREIFPRFD